MHSHMKGAGALALGLDFSAMHRSIAQGNKLADARTRIRWKFRLVNLASYR